MNTNFGIKKLIGLLATYIIHFCKNKNCENGWLGRDWFRLQSPCKRYYCDDCVKKGFKNPKPPRKMQK